MSFDFAVKYSVHFSNFKFGFKNVQKPLPVENPQSTAVLRDKGRVHVMHFCLERRLQTALNQHKGSSGRSRCTTTSEHPSP